MQKTFCEIGNTAYKTAVLYDNITATRYYPTIAFAKLAALHNVTFGGGYRIIKSYLRMNFDKNLFKITEDNYNEVKLCLKIQKSFAIPF